MIGVISTRLRLAAGLHTTLSKTGGSDPIGNGLDGACVPGVDGDGVVSKKNAGGKFVGEPGKLLCAMAMEENPK